MAAQAGYSGAPLLKKLGVKDSQRALLIAVPDEIDALADFAGWTNVKRAKTFRGASGGPFDYIHAFTADAAALAALPKLKALLAPAGMIWISWPKKSSGVASTVTEDIIRRKAIAAGLVDVKVCAVDDIWSGLKLVIPVKDRPK